MDEGTRAAMTIKDDAHTQFEHDLERARNEGREAEFIAEYYQAYLDRLLATS